MFWFLLLIDTCGITLFKENRPQHIKFINDIPHNIHTIHTICSYHENFINAVDALHKYVSTLPDYKNGFVRHFLCEETSTDCWFMKCENCSGISISQLSDSFGDVRPDTMVKWMIWKKSTVTNRIERHNQVGKLTQLTAHIAAISPQFLRHSYIKRSQSKTFTTYDRPRATNCEFADEGLLQIDFAENFVCELQDEVQSAHWNQRQLTLFTSALYFNDIYQSKVLVCDSLVHTKDTIVPMLCKLLEQLPKSMKVLKVWSDGPSSQFKNKYIAATITHLETRFKIKIIWNYFATSHGKGCIDGIGATSKCIVRKHIKARDCIVNSASDFVDAFNRTKSHIKVEEMTEKNFAIENKILGVKNIFKNAKDVRAIASAHQIQVIDGKIIIYTTSNEGYKI